MQNRDYMRVTNALLVMLRELQAANALCGLSDLRYFRHNEQIAVVVDDVAAERRALVRFLAHCLDHCPKFVASWDETMGDDDYALAKVLAQLRDSSDVAHVGDDHLFGRRWQPHIAFLSEYE